MAVLPGLGCDFCDGVFDEGFELGVEEVEGWLNVLGVVVRYFHRGAFPLWSRGRMVGLRRGWPWWSCQ